jgi:hypothetical protein
MSTRYHSIGRVGPGWPGRSDMPIPHPACSSENADEPRSPTTPRVEAFWPDGAGMPDPSRKRPPTKPVPEPSMLGRGLMHGRVRWLSRLPLRVWWHATVSIVPLVQGQGRPPGQASARCANKDSGPQGDPFQGGRRRAFLLAQLRRTLHLALGAMPFRTGRLPRKNKAPGAAWGGGAYRCPTCGGNAGVGF